MNYGRDVGTKFDKNGNVLDFPGNTVICNIQNENNVYSTIISVKEKLLELIDTSKYTFLPESSYHMTVIEGVCDQVRKQEKWSNYFNLNAPLEEIDNYFINQFREISIPDYFIMEYAGFEIDAVIIIKLKPKDQNEQLKINKFRDEVSEKLGIKFPGHDNYLFHITLAYNIIIDNDNSRICDIISIIDNYLIENFKEFKTEKPQLMFFENMFSFNKERLKNE